MKKIILLVTLFFLLGCASIREFTNLIENANTPIYYAINDFLRKDKKGNIFIVSTFDISNEIIAVSIIDMAELKWLLEDENSIIGTYQSYFPTAFFEKEGNFFYWLDSSKVVSQEILDKLHQYNLIESSIENMVIVMNDSKKATDYYFCKNDYSIFKKIITSKAVGWYSPPKLKCN